MCGLLRFGANPKTNKRGRDRSLTGGDWENHDHYGQEFLPAAE